MITYVVVWALLGELKGLIKLDFSNFNTHKVTDMSCMFFGCSSLFDLNISNFNTNNVTNMKDMFCLCSSFKDLDISKFNINNKIK